MGGEGIIGREGRGGERRGRKLAMDSTKFERTTTIVIRRSCFYSADQSSLSELVQAADDYLFNNIFCNKNMFLILF